MAGTLIRMAIVMAMLTGRHRQRPRLLTMIIMQTIRIHMLKTITTTRTMLQSCIHIRIHTASTLTPIPMTTTTCLLPP